MIWIDIFINNPSYIYNTYTPIGRLLYSKINPKLQDKIKHTEFIDMSDILVDHVTRSSAKVGWFGLTFLRTDEKIPKASVQFSIY
jgi:hypothetical protein